MNFFASPATLAAPAATDHAFAAPQGRLQTALAPFARRATMALLADAPGLSHPLVAFLEGEARTGVDSQGVLHGIPEGSRLLVCGAQPRAGRVELLVKSATATRRLLVYADVLQTAFTDGGDTLLEVIEARLAGLAA